MSKYSHQLQWLGVDVGWVFPAADSDGNVYPWTRRRRPVEEVALAGPVTVHRPNGATVIAPAYTRAAAAQAIARADRASYRNVANRIVSLAAKSHRTLALEDWSSFERRKTAWVGMWSMIANVAQDRDVQITQVDRAYTSITCPKCGHKDRGNRSTRDRFKCLECAFEGHADVIAAMNIAAKAAGVFLVADRVCLNPACDGIAWAANLCVRCYNFQRRHGLLPTVEEIQARINEPSVRRYRSLRQVQLLRERESRREAATRERMLESYRTHDAWGNPLDISLDISGESQ